MKTAFVSGASGGVGLEVSRLLRDAGWQVTAHYRSQPGTLEGVTWWQADLCGDYDLPPFARLDALIHCAGVVKLGKVSEAPPEDWLSAMAVNLHAPVALTNKLLPALRAAGGHMVYLNSGAGFRANPSWGSYAASKFAARAWCEALRAEEPAIRVTSIHPGRIDTDMQKQVVAQEHGRYDPSKYLRPGTVAAAVVHALDTPDDCDPIEMILRPRTH